MSDASEVNSQRDRSPAYPNIPIKAAIDRLVEFDAHFKRSAARPEKIGDAWGIKGKAYVDRTAAALRYFGLLEYQGTGKERHIVVADPGKAYLRSAQEEMKRNVVKHAALRPKQLAKFWGLWGKDRPADAACIDDLQFKHGFSEKGARDFLKVYDATIAYAGLSESDKSPTDLQDDGPEDEAEVVELPPALSPPPAPQGKVAPMQGERVVFTEEHTPQTYVKLIASGELDGTLLEALEDYVKRQKKRIETAYKAGVAQMAASGRQPPQSLISGASEDDEAAN